MSRSSRGTTAGQAELKARGGRGGEEEEEEEEEGRVYRYTGTDRSSVPIPSRETLIIIAYRVFIWQEALK